MCVYLCVRVNSVCVSILYSQDATDLYLRIRSLSYRDTAQWASGIDIDKGYLQIVREYVPTRYWQLTQ